MKHRQRILSLLLCAAMLCTMLFTPLHAEAHAASGTTCQHSWSTTTEERPCCGFSDGVEVSVTKCGKCGFTYMTAIRAGSWDGQGCPSYTTKTYPSETCSAHRGEVKECTVCGYAQLITFGGHEWTREETTTSGSGLCQTTITTLSCDCGAVDTQTTGGHRWSTNYIPATCTEPGKKVQECQVCHEKIETETAPALGHNFQRAPGAKCTDPRKCARCGATSSSNYSHDWKFVDTPEGHYQKCTACGETTDKIVKHFDNGDGKCVCGHVVAAGPSTCQHDYVVTGKVSGTWIPQHVERCSKCGNERKVDCSVNTADYSHRSLCTDPLYCLCGNKINDGQKNHNFGTWICHDSTHEHKCLNRDCQYGETKTHTFTTVRGITKCSVCNYALASAAHTHTGGTPDCEGNAVCATCGGTYQAGSKGSHTGGTANCLGVATCSKCGETYQTGASGSHTGGAPDCKGNAVCTVCHQTYQTGKTGSHTGGTEIRGAVAAQVGKAGYTGDTYCLTCGQKISSGSAIPALADGHTHSYDGSWSGDSLSHWHACQCGDKKDAAAHTFENGKCTVCGAADPKYLANVEHKHSYAEGWAADKENHWRVCSICGEKAETAAHTVADGKCTVCGLAVEAASTEKPSAEKFTDLTSGAWYYGAVERVVASGLMKGVTDETFAPDSTLDRAMLATVLYRLADNPPVDHGSSFVDVKANAYYADAVAWANENGIVEGKGGNSFAPGSNITRQEIATILYRYAVKAGYVTGGVGTLPDTYTDKGKVASWAQEAMAWAFQTKILTGRGAGQLAPEATASRAEAATMLVRFMDLIELPSA